MLESLFFDLASIKNPSAQLSLKYSDKSLGQLKGIEKFKNLTELDISGNSFTSTIPELFSLKFLKKLNLSQNSITHPGRYPETIEYLSLSCNKITQVNDHIQSLKLLQTIDLSFNQIQDLSSFSGLNNLKYLYLSNNLIKATLGIDSIPWIVELDLSSNLIKAKEDLVGLASCPQLLVVNLQNNQVIIELAKPKSGFLLDTSDQVLRDFSETESGLFYRDYEEIENFKSSRFRPVIQSTRPESMYAHQSASPDWGNSKIEEEITSDLHSFDEKELKISVLCENDEENLNKKVLVSKLNLEKIGHKVSCEKSSTKPETSLESLFEDIIAFFQIEGKQEKEFSFSSEKYEQAVNFLKSREDERRRLIGKNEKNIRKLEKIKNELEEQCLANGELKRHLEDLQEQVEKQDYLIRKLRVKNGAEAEVQTMDADESFVGNSFESGLSSFSQLPDLGVSVEFSKHLEGSEYLVHNNIKVYIEKLLRKISNLVKRKKLLRRENRKLSVLVFKNK